MKLSDDYIIVDKPKCWTSYDVVRYYKRFFNVKKIGHGGTLDPLATGLLILATNDNTKKLHNILGLDKEYEFEILFGLSTKTGDMEGKKLEDAEVVSVNKKELENCLGNLTGKINLTVPKYSAVKMKGKKLYDISRKGNNIDNTDLPVRENKIYKLKLIKLYKNKKRQIAKCIVKCSSGTYIRSLTEKIGEQLNIPATTYNIRRTRVGDYNLKNSIKPI